MKNLKNIYAVNLLIILSGFILLLNAQSAEVPLRGPIPFAAYDKDSSGFISEEEFNTVREERMNKKSAEGMPMRGAANAPSFSVFDINNDGQLSQDELLTGQKLQMEKRRGKGMGQGSGMGMGRNMPSFSEYDLDGDGAITGGEFNEARSKRMAERVQQGYQMKNLANAPSFADIDVDGDGKINKKEFSAHQAQHSQQNAQ